MKKLLSDHRPGRSAFFGLDEGGEKTLITLLVYIEKFVNTVSLTDKHISCGQLLTRDNYRRIIQLKFDYVIPGFGVSQCSCVRR